jgi:hypothetical protein
MTNFSLQPLDSDDVLPVVNKASATQLVNSRGQVHRTRPGTKEATMHVVYQLLLLGIKRSVLANQTIVLSHFDVCQRLIMDNR